MSKDLFSKFSLEGKVSIVTGASRGLGRAIAIALAEAGSDVAAVARSEGAIEETAEAIRGRGRRALALPCDVHDFKSVASAVDRVVDEFGRIDVLVNNAGGGDMKPIIEMTEEQWLRIVDLNVNSIFRMCKAAGPHMIKQRKGRVINMSSMYGLIGEKNVTAYCAAKGAIIQLTRALALEWAEHNITVNALAPGYIYTERTSRVFDNPDLSPAFIRNVPLGRIGTPEELGPLVVYMASDVSEFMTGSVIVIDGGQTAK
ncbi:MAG TPA: SDR family NAD(P)-dependent oxidoreductase [Blastocatellia bacterium]|nr:SDR family NAD(P)-dependent oxidoreductase [Blastocatellia bacterium]